MARYYCFRVKSPTQINLARVLSQRGWLATRIAWRAQVRDDWLDFPVKISETLEYKHLLADFCKAHGLSDLVPLTYYLDDLNWQEVVSQVSKEKWGRFILKPSLLNNGQSIHLFDKPDDLAAHFLTNRRMGGPHVLQRYIDPPHLIQGPSYGHKYSIRQLLVLSTHAGCGLFPQGYLNIALKPYVPDDFGLATHLTNEHLTHGRMNVVQRLSTEMDIYKPFEDRITLACQRICDALKNALPKQWLAESPYIGCFGIDFMVDASEKLWLLEVNHGPCFPTDTLHPLYVNLYAPFWEAVIDQFIEGNGSCFIKL